MHSGFASLRGFWPMNFSRTGMKHLIPSDVKNDIARIGDIWTSCRKEFGEGGPFLFGGFSIADAFLAPVVSRFQTYGPVDLPPLAAQYRDMMWALPAMKEWGESAAREAH
jgi:glutathione S-transferase